jgi:hypothetical protein
MSSTICEYIKLQKKNNAKIKEMNFLHEVEKACSKDLDHIHKLHQDFHITLTATYILHTGKTIK